MKGKPLDNIEFCQWLKHYYTNVATTEDYDGYAVREGVAAGTGSKMKKWAPFSGEAPKPAARKTASTRAAPMASNNARPTSRAAPASKASSSGASGAEVKALQEEVKTLKEEASELNLNVDALTKERAFYFGKLRDVEIMIQEAEGSEGVTEDKVEVFESIKAILYATDDTEAAEEEEY